MNTLTIAILVVCATAAYASALPEPRPLAVEAAPVAAGGEDIFEGAESRHGGGGYHKKGGYHNGGGNHGGGGNYGGGGYHGYHRGHH